MHNDLVEAGFECIQSEYPELIYDDYLKDKTSVRYVRKGHFIPEMELKLAKDELDDYQIQTRKKLPLTGLDLLKMQSTYESSILTSLMKKRSQR